jgi:S-formylglutathione hydrolase FrmB
MKPEIRVAVLFDGDAGEALACLAPLGHVWVVTSPSNERAVQVYWQNPARAFSVTTFIEIDATAPTAERLGIVAVIEGHRWGYSDTHEYPILEVVGLPLDAAAADYLRTFGFTRFEERSNGFVAHRPPRPHELP